MTQRIIGIQWISRNMIRIEKYRHLICLFSPITKIRVITVSKEDLTVADLRSQLEVIAKFALVYEGLNCGCKVAFKEEVTQVIEKLT